MFVSKPLSDDHLPASADGNIEDVHVSAFQTAVDGLLTAARYVQSQAPARYLCDHALTVLRSSAPSGVLPAMKAVVEAVTEVGEDVKTFEAKPNIDVDVSRLESLKHESTARLNTLMQAARNHAMASGLSPVSLLDAAAGHLTTNVIEIIKLLKIKRSDKNRDLRRRGSNMSIRDMVNRSNSRDFGKANGDWDREYGSRASSANGNHEERLRESPIPAPIITASTGMGGRPSPSPLNTQSYPQVSTPSELTPASASAHARPNGSNASSALMDRQNSQSHSFRVNSYQSASSQKSDSFDLERKASVSSNRGTDPRPMVESSRNGSLGPSGYNSNAASRVSPVPEAPMSPPGMPYEHDTSGEFGYDRSPDPASAPASASAAAAQQPAQNDGADEREWEDLKVSPACRVA